MSNSKTQAAIVLAIMRDQGRLDYDQPIAKYWPEFAQNGKADITVAQVLRHDAKLDLVPQKIDTEWGLTENVRDNKIGKVIESMGIVE